MLSATVVVPVFDTESYLSECLESLVNQTRKPLEIVVVDDCSPGCSLAAVETLQKRYPSIKHIRLEKNIGVLGARFKGAELAAGKYVGFLDSDDAARPDLVERLLAAAEETGADIIGSGMSGRGFFELDGSEAIITAYADKGIPNWHVWGNLYRRDLVLSLSQLRRIAYAENLTIGEDLLFNIHCALKNPSYAHVPNVLVDYKRARQGSAMNPTTASARRQHFLSLIRVFELLGAVAADFQEPIHRIVAASAGHTYKQIIAPGDDHDVLWACSQARKGLVGDIALSGMLQSADAMRRIYERRLSKSEKTLARLRVRLDLKVERVNQLLEEVYSLKSNKNLFHRYGARLKHAVRHFNLRRSLDQIRRW